MNNQKKQFLIGGIILVLLGIVLFYLLHLPQTQPAPQSIVSAVNVETQNARLFSPNETISTVEIQQQSDHYTLIFSQQARLTIPELTNFPVNDFLLTQVTSLLPAVETARVLDEVATSDVAQYGLQQPRATAMLRFANETTRTILIGDPVPGDMSRYYSMLSNDPVLYTMQATFAEIFLRPLEDYIDLQLVPPFSPTKTNQTPVVERLSIQRKDTMQEYIFEKNMLSPEQMRHTSSLKLVSPVQANASISKIDDQILPSLFGITAEKVVALNPKKKISSYGFDTPDMRLAVTYEQGEEVVLLFAAVPNQSDQYYIMQQNGLVVYQISQQSVPILNVELPTLISSVGETPSIFTVQQLTVTIEKNRHDFFLSGNEDQDNEDKFQIFYEKQPLSVREFKNFYMLLMSPELEQVTLETPDSPPVLQVEYDYYTSKEHTITSFYLHKGKMLYAVNGRIYASGSSAFLQKIQLELEHLLSNQPVQTQW